MINDIKIIIFCILIFTVIIITGNFTKSYLQKSSDLILVKINEIETLSNQAKWGEAYKKSMELENAWNGIEKKWALFVNHHEIDNITSSFINMKQFIKSRDSEQSLAYLHVFIHYVKHIPEMEKLSLKNIL